MNEAKHNFELKHDQDFTEIIAEGSEVKVHINHTTKSGHFTNGTEEFGGKLTFDQDKRLTDYDGVTFLPTIVVKMIRKAGYVVPRHMV